MTKTTKTHFDIFKKEAAKWVLFFGLTDWEITYCHENLDELRAQCSYDLTSRIATISLTTIYCDRILYNSLEEDIRKSAFHEVCELLLGPLNYMVGQRFNLCGVDVEEGVHSIIRRLENSVFKGRGK